MVEQVPTNPPAFPTEFNADINNLKIYEKGKDGKYWFEFISTEQMKEKPTAWGKFISRSMADYYTIIKNQGHAPEYHLGFIKYVQSAVIFLTMHECKIILPC